MDFQIRRFIIILIILSGFFLFGILPCYGGTLLYVSDSMTNRVINETPVTHVITLRVTDTGTINTVTMQFSPGFNLNNVTLGETQGIGSGYLYHESGSNTVFYIVSSPVQINAGTVIKITLNNIINASLVANTYTVTVSTISDTGAIIDGPTPTPNFVLSDHSTFNPSSSYITFLPYYIKADGTSACTAVVTINDLSGYPVSNTTVVLSTSRPNSDTIKDSTGAINNTQFTDSNGVCTFTISSNYAGWDTITAICEGNTITNGVNKYGTVVIYHFDTDTLDYSGYGNNGVACNGPVWVTGKSGSALQFDGVDDYMEIQNSQNMRYNPQTVYLWVKPGYQDARTYNNHNDILRKGDEWSISTTDNFNTSYRLLTQMRYLYGPSNMWSPATPVNINAWNFVCVIWQRDAGGTVIMKSFINGTWEEYSIGGGSDWTDASPLKIATGYSGEFNGIIDEVCIYNRALSADEIKASYENKVNIYFTAVKLKIVSSSFLVMQNQSSPKITVIASGNAGNTDTTFNDTIDIISSSGTGRFSLDATNWTASNTTVILLSSGAGNFYYKDSSVCTPTITVSRAGLLSDAQQETVSLNPNAIKLAIITPVRTIPAGSVSDSIVIQAWKVNNTVDSSYAGTCTFSSSSTAGKFCANSAGETWTSTIVLQMINGETFIYYKDTRAGSPAITVTSGTLTNTSQIQSVSPGIFNDTSSCITFNPYKISADGSSSCTAVITICDTYGNPIQGIQVNLSTPRGTQDTITTIANTTDSNGNCTFTIQSSIAGLDTLTAVISGYPNDTVTRGVNKYGAVGIWHLDDLSTIALDVSGYNNTGTLTNGPVYVSGKYGSALQFDGVDDYVEVLSSSSLNPTDAVTIEVWINERDNPNWKKTIRKAGQYAIGLGGGDDFYLQIGDGSSDQGVGYGVGTGGISHNAWHHLVFLYDYKAQRAEGWIDGVLIGTNWIGSWSPIGTTSNNLIIGGYNSSSTFNATLDEVKIYNRALSADEIKASYNSKANFYFTASRLKLTSSSFSVMQNQSSPKITVIASGNAGNTDTTFSDTIDIISSSGTGKFSVNGVNWSASNTTSITLSAGIGNFYYKDDNIGTPTITVSRAGLNSDAQQETITVNLNAIKLAIVTPVRTINAGSVSDSICVQAWSANNIPDATFNGTCTFSTSSTRGGFCITQSGETWTSTIVLQMINGETFIYYKDTKAGSPTITVTSGTLTDTSQVQSVVTSFNNTSSYITFTPYQIQADGTSICTAVVTICDTYGNPIPDKSVSLYSSRGIQDTITTIAGTTDANGKCTFTISSGYTGWDTIVAVVSEYPNDTITRGVNKYASVGIWNFDTDTLDYSGYGNNGVAYNGPLWVTGKFGSALQFDGVDDYVEVPSSTIGTEEQMTIELWVKPSDQIAGAYNYHKDIIRSNCYGGGKWAISTSDYFNTNNQLIMFSTWITGVDGWWNPSEATVTKNEWNHIALVLDRTTGKATFYRNGQYIVETTLSVGVKPTTTGFRIGSDCAGPFKGIIDEVKIYNRALSADEIKGSYQSKANIYFKASHLKITSPVTKIKAGSPSPAITVNASGAAGGVDATFAGTGTLTSNSESRSFSLDGNNWGTIGSDTIVSISQGFGYFYYRDYKSGDAVVTVSRSDSELQSGTQIVMIRASSMVITSPAFTISTTDSASVQVTAYNYSGTQDSTFNETVMLSSTSSKGKFSLSNTTWQDTSVVKFSNGSTIFYHKDKRGGNPVITILHPELVLSATQVESITMPVVTVSKQMKNERSSVSGTLVPATADDTIEYTITITNNGTETATNIIVTDTVAFDTNNYSPLAFVSMDTADTYAYTTDPSGINWISGMPAVSDQEKIKGLRWKVNTLIPAEEKQLKFRIRIK